MDFTYNQAALEEDKAANCGRAYRQCAIGVMDTIADPDISFDSDGVCNYYHDFKHQERESVFTGEAGEKKLEEMVARIKQAAKGQPYDCILGLSGGADSTYVAYLARELELKPLIVHFDYGWNLELAVKNIEQAVKVLGFNLFTHVINWEEFKDIQRSYFKASVLDVDVPADHLIFSSLAQTARKHKIKYILNGCNVATEGVLPPSWNYNRKLDGRNLINIHKRFGQRALKTSPIYTVFLRSYDWYVTGLRNATPLNFVDYNKQKVCKVLSEELGWTDYGGKHCENTFTRFYQGYILPVRYNIDKRKAHLSTMVYSGQLSKEEALAELAKPPYDLNEMADDEEYIAKKLGFSHQEFIDLISLPPKSHAEYGEAVALENGIEKLKSLVRPLKRLASAH